MPTIKLDMTTLEQAGRDFTAAWHRATADQGAGRSPPPDAVTCYGFARPDLLWAVLNANRWAILTAMTGQGAMSLRDLARRVGRDVRRVHDDADVLLDAGLLERTQTGHLHFPYDRLEAHFVLEPAAA